MKRYNISVPRKYTKDNVEKTSWSNVGKLIKFEATSDKPEGYVLELAMFPDTKFGVFEDKPREATATVSQDIEAPQEVIDEGEIPF